MKRFPICILIFSFLNYIGCYTSSVSDKELFFSETSNYIVDDFIIETVDDERIKIIWDTYFTKDDTLYARGLKYGDIFSYPIDLKIALSDIKQVEVDEFNGLATAGCIIGSAGIIFFIIVAIAVVTYEPKSCGVESLNDLK